MTRSKGKASQGRFTTRAETVEFTGFQLAFGKTMDSLLQIRKALWKSNESEKLTWLFAALLPTIRDETESDSLRDAFESFADAVSHRIRKHLRWDRDVVDAGYRIAEHEIDQLLEVVNRGEVSPSFLKLADELARRPQAARIASMTEAAEATLSIEEEIPSGTFIEAREAALDDVDSNSVIHETREMHEAHLKAVSPQRPNV